jgi:hypothetical protein
MSFLVPPLAFDALVGSSTGVYVSGSPVAALLLLVTLAVAKQAAVNTSGDAYKRFSRCLDVGVVPLAIAGLAIAAREAARILD